MPEVLWLDEIGDEDGPRVGGKAASLARLRRAGLPVPDGFVLTAGADLTGGRREALLAAYARLGGRVAVRSSAAAEDRAEASFAGQYRTVLDVRDAGGLLEAASACLGSALDASAYARAVGVPTSASAILVQRFVEPRAAGVAFTRHPQDPGALLIESHAGRGEALVSGRVSPDRYVLDRATRALRDGPPGGSLDAASVAQVAALALRAEELLGAPQDVEWAIGADGPVVLQSRPITVEAEEARDARVRRLTRANVGEVLPDPVTPLTWTTVGTFLEHAFRAVALEARLLPPDAPAFLVLHRRRLYLNLTLAVEVGVRLPGISRADAQRLVLGGRPAQGPPARISLPALLAKTPLLLRLLRLGARLPRQIEACAERIRRLPGPAEIAAADPPRLAALLRDFVETGRSVATIHVATSGASALRLALLRRLLGSVVPDAADLLNRLAGGAGEVESAAPAVAIEALSEEATARPDWSAWLSLPTREAARALLRGEAPAELGERLRDFLDRFGHRGLSEGELRSSAWEDDPSPVLDALRTALEAPGRAGFARRALAEVRRADEEALLARLGPLRRILHQWALAGSRDAVRRRERTKSLAVALVHHGRRLARAAARRLVATGALGEEDDAYFVTVGELLAALEGAPVPASAVARRRRRQEREGAMPAPREVDLEEPGAAGAPAGPSGLAGTGVSPGIGSGPARVVPAGTEPRLEPGEVLVAPVLDAALGPLLASASGAVAEIGALLSHGSVVARELGVPCVVDVREATSRIRTGDLVEVDGSAGRVTLLGPEAPAGAVGERASLLEPSDPADEAFRPLEPHPLARESVYVNVQDPRQGLAIVGSLGIKAGGRGESLLALSLPDGRVLFGLDRSRPQLLGDGVRVGGVSTSWRPVRLRFQGTLAPHEGGSFPPPPVRLALSSRTVPVTIDLALVPTTPAIDFCQGLPEDLLASLHPVGRHHVEQSGLWVGEIAFEGRRIAFEGTGSRDHSWGIRDWEAADHWRLFTVRLGDELAVHALSVSVRGRVVEGGFLWRDGRAEAIRRVRYAAEREQDRVRGLELEVSTLGARLALRGTVWRTLKVPVQLERRLWRHLLGRPYRLILHENFAIYEAEGRVGHGMAELTERPL